MTPSLAAHSVGMRIGRAELLRGVSLAVVPGEVLAIVGPNGAGKSTLLRLLSGELRPTAGEVTLLDRPLGAWSHQERATRRAVLQSETAPAFPFLVDEVVLMGRAPHHGGRESGADRHIAAEALAAVGCTHLADRILATLSSGERQRVQLARALTQIWAGADVPDPAPRFLLLDEPTSNLDLAHQHAALALVRDFSRRAVGALVVLHDLNLAAEYADRIALLRDGAIVGVGTPDQVLRADILERVFDIPIMVVPHPRLSHPLVVPDPTALRPSVPGPRV